MMGLVVEQLIIKIDPEHPARSLVSNFMRHNSPPDISPETDLRSFVHIGLSWQEKLWSEKILGNFVPTELGGKGGSYYDEAITLEELGLLGSPQLPGIFGITMLAPILLSRGDTVLQQFVPRIFEGSELVCQLFSEPEAGSDLWSLKTKLIDDGDRYLLSGQKIWTSFAEFATVGFGLARVADPEDDRKHLGIQFFIIRLKDQPLGAVTVRPIKQISGESEFCEVFFDNAVVRKDEVIGTAADGWKLALETLNIERSLLTFARHTQTIRLIRKIFDILDTRFEEEFFNLVAEFNLLRISAYRHIETWRRSGQIGPYGSVDKLSWSENFKRFAKLFRKLAVRLGDEQLINEADKTYLYSLGRTIAAGTSEIQKLTIAQRLLGLPKSY